MAVRKPTKSKNEIKIPFSIGIAPDLAAEIDSLTKPLDRSRSWIAEKLLLRGLAAFKRDGLLTEPAQEQEIELIRIPKTTESVRTKKHTGT